MRKNIVLIGFMGTGKTAVGRRLARRLKRKFVDTDAEIEKITGKTIAQIFARDGATRFRSEEALLVKKLAPKEGLVISTGGGLVLNPENVRLLRENGIFVALAADPDKAAQFNDGVAAAIEIKRAEREGTATQEQLDTWAFLDAVAFSTVRELVGLDALELAITGAAPLPAQILEWFNAIGVPLSEIYGMSESTGPISWSPHANRPGWVGQAIPGMEVAIADDGEVIARGGNVFQGYLKQPEKTAETIIDGWLHTGDIGELDEDGYLRIVDRKKELIITSGGKNISPANLEAALKMIPIVGQACAVGDQRKYVSALLVLDPEAAPQWAASHGLGGLSLPELAEHPDVIAEVQAGVDGVNQQFAQAEQVKRFVLLGEEWLPDSDVLTPTSKLKRRGIHARYADKIESMYAELAQSSDETERYTVVRDAFPNQNHLRVALLALIRLLDPGRRSAESGLAEADADLLIRTLLFEERHVGELDAMGANHHVEPGVALRPPLGQFS